MRACFLREEEPAGYHGLTEARPRGRASNERGVPTTGGAALRAGFVEHQINAFIRTFT
jgi:hypothetical protein